MNAPRSIRWASDGIVVGTTVLVNPICIDVSPLIVFPVDRRRISATRTGKFLPYFDRIGMHAIWGRVSLPIIVHAVDIDCE